MPNGAALDTDVLLKISAYRLAGDLIDIVRPFGQPGTLGLTHIIAAKQLARKRGVRDGAGAAVELAVLLAQLERLEPDEEEIALAADLAARAQELSLPLDAGEAQLAAVSARRGLPMLVTGDKRALVALATMLADDAERPNFAGRLVCLEQVLATLAAAIGEGALRGRVCAEPDVDTAMRLACSCGRDGWELKQLHEALDSYIGALAAETGDLLRPGSLLT